MILKSADFAAEAAIPDRCALCRPVAGGAPEFSDNQSPELHWEDLPSGTQSLALMCIDLSAPTVGDDVNQEGRSVATALPRAEFVHWLMADIPADCTGLSSGQCSRGVQVGGKAAPPGPGGVVQGVNDYTAWFAGDEQMEGAYLGYDGPCPPWNDELTHRYEFRLYALDCSGVGLEPGFSLADLRASIESHTLAEASLVGTYTLNPLLRQV